MHTNILMDLNVICQFSSATVQNVSMLLLAVTSHSASKEINGHYDHFYDIFLSGPKQCADQQTVKSSSPHREPLELPRLEQQIIKMVSATSAAGHTWIKLLTARTAGWLLLLVQQSLSQTVAMYSSMYYTVPYVCQNTVYCLLQACRAVSSDRQAYCIFSLAQSCGTIFGKGKLDVTFVFPPTTSIKASFSALPVSVWNAFACARWKQCLKKYSKADFLHLPLLHVAQGWAEN